MPGPFLVSLRSPKSIESPVVAIVTYCMVLAAGLPPPYTPLPSGLAVPEQETNQYAVTKSPKSVALPVVLGVT